jgi:general secretion pathway protein G
MSFLRPFSFETGLLYTANCYTCNLMPIYSHSSACRSRARAGFSLLEILIAIALLAVVATLVITNLDGVLGGGQEKVARIFVEESMTTPLMRYRVDMGRYPSTDEGLRVLITAPSENAGNWRGPYVDKLPNDPWGQPYQYRFPGEKNPSGYDLWSWGPSGERDIDKAIGNWNKATN